MSTSVLLMGIPYALALGQEQEIMEREREEGLMREGASSVSPIPSQEAALFSHSDGSMSIGAELTYGKMLQAGEADAPGATAPQGGQGGKPSL